MAENCRLEKGAVSTGGNGVKKLPFTGLLEIMPTFCFQWVRTISNRGLRY
jgi:hypothetical protein